MQKEGSHFIRSTVVTGSTPVEVSTPQGWCIRNIIVTGTALGASATLDVTDSLNGDTILHLGAGQANIKKSYSPVGKTSTPSGADVTTSFRFFYPQKGITLTAGGTVNANANVIVFVVATQYNPFLYSRNDVGDFWSGTVTLTDYTAQLVDIPEGYCLKDVIVGNDSLGASGELWITSRTYNYMTIFTLPAGKANQKGAYIPCCTYTNSSDGSNIPFSATPWLLYDGIWIAPGGTIPNDLSCPITIIASSNCVF